MNRRGFLSAAAVAPAALVPTAAVPKRKTLGFVDVDRWKFLGLQKDGYRLFVDGVDVKKCWQFNDEEGWADCFDDPIRLNRDKTEILGRRLFGFVEVRKP